MVLEIIAAAVLIAFGLLAVYFSLENKPGDKDLLVVLLIGIASFIAGAWIIFTKLTLAVILTKLAGLVLAFIGAFLIFGFPDISDYQPAGMSKAGVFVGLVFLIIGGWLLFF